MNRRRFLGRLAAAVFGAITLTLGEQLAPPRAIIQGQIGYLYGVKWYRSDTIPMRAQFLPLMLDKADGTYIALK